MMMMIHTQVCLPARGERKQKVVGWCSQCHHHHHHHHHHHTPVCHFWWIKCLMSSSSKSLIDVSLNLNPAIVSSRPPDDDEHLWSFTSEQRQDPPEHLKYLETCCKRFKTTQKPSSGSSTRVIQVSRLFRSQTDFINDVIQHLQLRFRPLKRHK